MAEMPSPAEADATTAHREGGLTTTLHHQGWVVRLRHLIAERWSLIWPPRATVVFVGSAFICSALVVVLHSITAFTINTNTTTASGTSVYYSAVGVVVSSVLLLLGSALLLTGALAQRLWVRVGIVVSLIAAYALAPIWQDFRETVNGKLVTDFSWVNSSQWTYLALIVISQLLASFSLPLINKRYLERSRARQSMQSLVVVASFVVNLLLITGLIVSSSTTSLGWIPDFPPLANQLLSPILSIETLFLNSLYGHDASALTLLAQNLLEAQFTFVRTWVSFLPLVLVVKGVDLVYKATERSQTATEIMSELAHRTERMIAGPAGLQHEGADKDAQSRAPSEIAMRSAQQEYRGSGVQVRRNTVNESGITAISAQTLEGAFTEVKSWQRRHFSVTWRLALLLALSLVSLVMSSQSLWGNTPGAVALGELLATASAGALIGCVWLLKQVASLKHAVTPMVPTAAVAVLGACWQAGSQVIGQTLPMVKTDHTTFIPLDLFAYIVGPPALAAVFVGIPLLWWARSTDGKHSKSAAAGLLLLIAALYSLWDFLSWWLNGVPCSALSCHATIDPVAGSILAGALVSLGSFAWLLWRRRLRAGATLFTRLAAAQATLLLVNISLMRSSDTFNALIGPAAIATLGALLWGLLSDALAARREWQKHEQKPYPPSLFRSEYGQLWATTGFTLVLAALITWTSAANPPYVVLGLDAWQSTGVYVIGLPLLATIVTLSLITWKPQASDEAKSRELAQEVSQSAAD